MAKKIQLKSKQLVENDFRRLIRAMIEQEMDKIDVGDEEDKFDVDEKCEEDELEEVSSVTAQGGQDGYQTPYAFAGKHKEKQKQNAEQLGYKLVNEPEDRDWKDLEDARKEPLVWRKKFGENIKGDSETMSENINEVKYRGYDIKKQNRKDSHPYYVPALKVTGASMKDVKDQIDKALNEGRRGAYQNYRDDENMTTRQKIGESLRSVRNQLAEVEKTIDLNLRLKQETGINSQEYWKRTTRALNRINEKMTRIINKIRRF